MNIIAHRGYKTHLIKENTEEAFTNAVNNEFLGIECDVRETKDNKLVIIHDASIDRTSNGSGLVSNMTYDELLKYNFGTDDIPSKIPLFKNVLKNYKGVMKLIELKSRLDISSILEMVDENTYFMSFDTTYMKELKRKYPKLKCGILNYVLNSSSEYDLDFVCILDFVATDKIVEKFLRRGKKVFIYGIVGKIDYLRDYQNLYYIVDKKFTS